MINHKCFSLEKFKIDGLPSCAYYIPNFIDSVEEESLIHHVYNAPKVKWTCLKGRRLQNWGGLPHPKGMVREEIPAWLKTYMERITQTTDTFHDDHKPNHVLVNEYLPGQGIMPHEDGPLFHPVITTISLGSHILLDVYDHLNRVSDNNQVEKNSGDYESRFVGSIFLERKSLLILTKDLYTDYLHGIKETTSDVVDDKCVKNVHLCENINNGQSYDRSTRISLTIRNFPKVLKVKLKLSR
ncbi:ALKBH6 (predicted) [Pycnogonum litorale]